MKVLLICESINANQSGGKAATFIHKVLTCRGHNVSVAITQRQGMSLQSESIPNSIIFDISEPRRFLRALSRLKSLVLGPKPDKKLHALLTRLKPDIVHFASFDHTKSINLYETCVRLNLKTVLQPWTMHFYCAQGFSYRKSAHCTLCIEKGFINAITQKCISAQSFLKQLEKYQLKKVVMRLKVKVLSSSVSFDSILTKYGFSEKDVCRFPIPYEPKRTISNDFKVGDYYIYYGHPAEHKGVGKIIEIFTDIPDKTLIIAPSVPIEDQRLPENVRVRNGLEWGNGLEQAIKNSKAVIISSLWETSTEYSLYEAMELGKPIIAFNVGVHRDILKDKVNAYVIEPVDKTGFIKALTQIENDRNLVNRIVDNAQMTLQSINDPKSLSLKLEEIYTSYPLG